MIEAITTPPPPGKCRTVTTEIGSRKPTLKATPVKAAKTGEESWAFKITTSPGDAPILVKWFRFGPYLAEVRIGTVGNRPNDQINIKTLYQAARLAHDRAVRNLT